jgi:hypothetical protein
MENFGIWYAHLLFLSIWYILLLFSSYFAILVISTQKNLAALPARFVSLELKSDRLTICAAEMWRGFDNWTSTAKEKKRRRRHFSFRRRHQSGDRCYHFLNIFAKKFLRKNWRFWLKTKANNAKFWSWHWFWEKRQFFRRKLSKIAENYDHNINPDRGTL